MRRLVLEEALNPDGTEPPLATERPELPWFDLPRSHGYPGAGTAPTLQLRAARAVTAVEMLLEWFEVEEVHSAGLGAFSDASASL